MMTTEQKINYDYTAKTDFVIEFQNAYGLSGDLEVHQNFLSLMQQIDFAILTKR